MKYFFSFLFYFSLFYQVSAQVNQEYQIADSHKLAFAKIYLESKKLNINIDSLINSTLEKSGLSEQRIKEILVSGFNLEKVTLSQEEMKAKEVFLEYQSLIDKSKENRIQALCLQEKLDVSMYHFMVAEYKNNLEFHNTLKPFFKQVIERL